MPLENEPRRINKSEFDWLILNQITYWLEQIGDAEQAIGQLQKLSQTVMAAEALGKRVKLFEQGTQIYYEVEDRPTMGFKGVHD